MVWAFGMTAKDVVLQGSYRGFVRGLSASGFEGVWLRGRRV